MMLLASCSPGKPEQKNESGEPKDPNLRVITEKYPNGRVKSTTEARGNLRHGASKEYRKDGTLETVINYENNRKQGPARNYYPDGKTVKTEIIYVQGFKHGETKWYFPDGQIYRITPYVNGAIKGIRKVYYENGNLLAEIPYQDSQPGMGLKEYNSDGSPKEFTWRIVFDEEDRINLDNSFKLIITLSGGYENVEFYNGKLTDGKYWNDRLAPIDTENGRGVMSFHVSRGSFKMETINVIARIKTSLNNYQIIQREYHLALENKF
jgi:antitoxin component YwqK of YwqJK toxin-antitoxin module